MDDKRNSLQPKLITLYLIRSDCRASAARLLLLTLTHIMILDSVLFLGLVVLFLKLRKVKPWAPAIELDKNDLTYNKPIQELIVSESVISLTTIPLPILLLQLLTFFSDDFGQEVVKKYAFGLVLFFDAVLVLKLMVGRPRPNAATIEERFKEGKQEISMKMDYQLESRQSFPSAHSFLAAFASMFFVIVVRHGLKDQSIFSATIQVTLLLLGAYPGVCQANTFWHHWSDVVSGHLIGTLAAVYSYFYML